MAFAVFRKLFFAPIAPACHQAGFIALFAIQKNSIAKDARFTQETQVRTQRMLATKATKKIHKGHKDFWSQRTQRRYTKNTKGIYEVYDLDPSWFLVHFVFHFYMIKVIGNKAFAAFAPAIRQGSWRSLRYKKVKIVSQGTQGLRKVRKSGHKEC